MKFFVFEISIWIYLKEFYGVYDNCDKDVF